MTDYVTSVTGAGEMTEAEGVLSFDPDSHPMRRAVSGMLSILGKRERSHWL